VKKSLSNGSWQWIGSSFGGAVVHELAAHNRTMKIGTIKSKPATFEGQA
jgi:hypothetical protein